MPDMHKTGDAFGNRAKFGPTSQLSPAEVFENDSLHRTNLKTRGKLSYTLRPGSVSPERKKLIIARAGVQNPGLSSTHGDLRSSVVLEW